MVTYVSHIFYTFHTFLWLNVTIHKMVKKKFVYINFVPSSTNLQCAILHSTMVKVKQSLYRPGVAQRVPGS